MAVNTRKLGCQAPLSMRSLRHCLSPYGKGYHCPHFTGRTNHTGIEKGKGLPNSQPVKWQVQDLNPRSLASESVCHPEWGKPPALAF